MEQHTYQIGAFLFSEKKKTARITVYVSNKLFKINLSEQSFQQSPALLESFLLLLSRLEGNHEPDDGDAWQDMHDWILEPFLPVFGVFSQHQNPRKYTFDEWLFPETLCYTVSVTEGNLVPVSLTQQPSAKNPDVGSNLTECEDAMNIDYSMFPVYSPKDVTIATATYSNSLPDVPRKAFIKGEPSFLKVVWAGDARTTNRELSKYAMIHAAGFDATVHISRLNGLVRDDNGCVVGLLLTYIDCGDRGPLDCIDVSNPKYSGLKGKWFDQIKQTLRHLHSHGITWGDAAATNILIDIKDDAYLVDFGGGFTPGWVEQEKSNSMEGDLQGLERIRKFLFS